MTFWGSRWYDMDGNELRDLTATDDLLGDIQKRRVALTDFDGRAEVSTVLLVLLRGMLANFDAEVAALEAPTATAYEDREQP